MGLRDAARADQATQAGPGTPEQPQGAPGPVVAAAEQKALTDSVNRAVDRHGVPDSHVYLPDAGTMADGRLYGRDAEKAIEVRAPQGGPRLVMGTPLQLTEAQYRVLLAGINANRVSIKQRQSHLEAWDVRRYLTKIFGFGGWTVRTLSLTKIHERATPPGDGTVWRGYGDSKKKVPNDDWMYTVVYEAQVALTIFNPDGTVGAYFEDGATGDGINMPTYQQAADFALKTALSQALKRCAVNLGDQFGLSLYNHGSKAAQVEITLRPPTWEGVPDGDAAVKAATENERVRGEEETQGDDPDRLPTAQELANEALEKADDLTRLRAIYAMVNRKKGDHPEIGQTTIINGVGDEEPLDYLIYNLMQERKQRGEQA